MGQKEMLEKLTAVVERAHVNAVFGAPQTVGEVTVIPYAEVACGFGLGMGSSGPECRCTCEEGEQEGCACEEVSASGGGGGAGMRARPLGYIEISPAGTTIKPIVDEQRVVLAALVLSAWSVAWIGLVLKAIFGRR